MHKKYLILNNKGVTMRGSMRDSVEEKFIDSYQ